MIVFIALAKGELGKDTERYLQNYGLAVRLDGRPLQFVQRIDSRVFRPMQSKDVPWYVAEVADYGITGEDLTAEYTLENGSRINILERLGFGKGDLVVFAKADIADVKRNLKKKPIVAAPYYYKNLLEIGQAGNCIRAMLEEFEPRYVNGSTEGFVADGGADIGFDLTTYFQKLPEERNTATLIKNGLKIVERIMPTEAVVIAKPCYTSEDFRIMLGTPRKKERRIVTTGNIYEVEVVKYSDG